MVANSGDSRSNKHELGSAGISQNPRGYGGQEHSGASAMGGQQRMAIPGRKCAGICEPERRAHRR